MDKSFNCREEVLVDVAGLVARALLDAGVIDPAEWERLRQNRIAFGQAVIKSAEGILEPGEPVTLKDPDKRELLFK